MTFLGAVYKANIFQKLQNSRKECMKSVIDALNIFYESKAHERCRQIYVSYLACYSEMGEDIYNNDIALKHLHLRNILKLEYKRHTMLHIHLN